MNAPTQRAPQILAVAFSALAAHAANPAHQLFEAGYNLCHATPLSAVRIAGEQPYRKGLFANGVCTWERTDLKAGLVLSTHPRRTGLALMLGLLHQNGRNGLHAAPIRVPGAQRGVLVTLPRSTANEITKDLFALYAPGVIQVDMTAPRLPNARLLAVMKLLSKA